MTIPTSELQKPGPSPLVELFELDLTVLGDIVYYFHAGTNQIAQPVFWQGIEYAPFPVEADGFDKAGQGTQVRPTIRVANVSQDISALCRAFDDLIGGKITRRRTFLKYLDAVNFTGGMNPTADPTVEFPDEIWFVNRKAEENDIFITFELASAFDAAGKQLPGRQCIANTCTWLYRGPECGYAGGFVDINGNATADASLDVCSKALATGCKPRFGAFAVLPYGGFPAAGLVR